MTASKITFKSVKKTTTKNYDINTYSKIMTLLKPLQSFLFISRRFQTFEPLSIKFKIKLPEIKDPDADQPVTPLDYEAITPGRTERKLKEPSQQESDIYREKLRQRLTMSDPVGAKKLMKSWPLVRTEMRSLADEDIPLGIKFNVAYHDTHAFVRHSGPVVLVVHGLQLPQANFASFVEPLLAQGARVIAPLFPYIGHNIFKPNPAQLTTSADMKLYSHSTLERFLFLGDFVKQVVGAKKVDVVICSDVGAYPAAWFCAYSGLVKSAVFLDPFSVAVLPCMRPVWLFKMMTWIWEILYWRVALSWLLLPFLGVLMQRFGSTSFKEASAHMRHLAFADLGSYDGALTVLEMNAFPVLVYASKQNKFVPKPDMEKFMFRLGIRAKDIREGQSESKEKSQRMTSSFGVFYDPVEGDDDFANYNRRYAQADFARLGKPICDDVQKLLKFVSQGKSAKENLKFVSQP